MRLALTKYLLTDNQKIIYDMNNHVDVNVCGVQGLVPCTYKTVVLKPNVIDDKNILTQSMMNKPNTKYVIKYDFLLSDAIVEKTVNVVSTNVSQCGNAAYSEALAAYNLAHDAWIDADNAYTNDPNDTTLAAKNAAYAALEAAQLTLNGTPQYYYFAGSAINIKKGQHITIPEGCVLLNDTRNGIVNFDVAPNDMTVYIGSATTGNYNYKIQDGIEMPANCLIEFDGGSISNGVLVGDETILIFDQEEEVILKNVELLGEFEYSAGGNGDINKKDNVDGMATITLKKNKSFKDQLTKTNTIYRIMYDFDLGGERVYIPEKCVLDFEGGGLYNGIIVGQNTCIDADLVKIFNSDITFEGTWNIEKLFPEWFEFVNGDASTAINKCVSIIKLNGGGTIWFSQHEYVLYDLVDLTDCSNLIITGSKSVLQKPAENYRIMFTGNHCRNITISNLVLKGAWTNKEVEIPGSGWKDDFCDAIIIASFSENITIEDLELYDFWYGIFIGGESGEDGLVDTSKCSIRNCYFDGVRAAIDTYSRLQATIEGNIIKNSSFIAIQIESTYGIDTDDYDYENIQATVEGFIIRNNTICNSSDGIAFQYTADGKLSNSNVAILDNKFYNLTGGAIGVTSCRGTRIDGNFIENCKSSIAVWGKWMDFVASHNIIQKCYNGISLYDDSAYKHFGIVSHNRLENISGTCAIFINASNLKITDNIIRNNINSAANRSAILLNSGENNIVANNTYIGDYEEGNPSYIISVEWNHATKHNYIGGNIANIAMTPVFWYNESEGVIDEKQYPTAQGLPITTVDAWADNATTLFPQRHEIFYSKREGRHLTIMDNGLTYEFVIRRGAFETTYANKPTDPALSQIFYATDLKRILFYNGYDWIDNNGLSPFPSAGDGIPQTNPPSNEEGNLYFDKTTNIPIWWNGNRWNTVDGAYVDIQRSGTWANRPTDGTLIYEGFMYMINDTSSTPEKHFPIYAHVSGATITWYKADGTQYTGS